MEISGGITASLQGRYAVALFELGQDHKAVAAIEADVARLRAALDGNADFAALIRNPRVSRAEGGKALAGLAKLLKLNVLTANFLGVLAANGRLAVLPETLAAFTEIAATARGEIAAHVTSAHPLSAAQLKTLSARLALREGREVTLTTQVDPDLLGGLVVRVGSTQIDSSIRTRLNALALAMTG